VQHQYTGQLTGDAAADALLASSPLALLLGMLLDQRMPMERAFLGPYRMQERLGHLDAVRIATMDPDDLEAAFRKPPAVHRYPGSMAGRAGDLCRMLVEEHDADPQVLWRDVDDAAVLRRRLAALPGFGPQKVKIFVALLAKQCGVRPAGWEIVAGEYAEEGYQSVADVVVFDDIAAVRETKQAKKAAARQD
jgi:uncharacterized HhH-GPD family protein